MPQSITTVTTLKSRCQRRLGDSGTGYWSTAEWYNVLNEVELQILNHLMSVGAVPLFDYLLDNINLTLTAGSSSVTYQSQITNASKTFYKFWKAEWDSYPVAIISNQDRWLPATYQNQYSSTNPCMTWSTNGTALLYPEPTSSTTSDFYFWWVKKPVAMDELTDTFSLSEPTMSLFVHRIAEEYWASRNIYDKAAYEEQLYDKKFDQIVSPYKSSKTHVLRSATKD